MKSLWINSTFIAAMLLVSAVLVPAWSHSQGEPPAQPTEAEDVRDEMEKLEAFVGLSDEEKKKAVEQAIALGSEIDVLFRHLRSYQPDDVINLLKDSQLPSDLQALFKGWAFHQMGLYDQALAEFERVDAEQLKSEQFLANRHEELMKTAEALRKFEVVETENFSIRYQPGPDEVMLFYLPEFLERFYATYAPMFQFHREDKIIVELMPDYHLFSYASALTKGQIETTGTIALCVENRLVMMTPRRVARGYEWPDTVAHEFVHYVLTKISEDRVPLWMQEGVAKWLERYWRDPNAPKLDPALETSMALAVKNNHFITTEEMMPSFAALPTAELARQAYAQTTSMIDYLVSRHDIDLIRQTAVLLREQKGDMDATMKALINKDFATFEAQWQDWARTQTFRVFESFDPMSVTLLDNDGKEEGLKELEELTQTTKKHTRLGDLLLERNRYSAALEQYEKTALPNQTLDRQIVLRMLKCLQGMDRYGDIINLIDREVAHVDTDTTMLIYKAEAQVGLNRLDDARTNLTRAIEINPFFPAIFQLLIQTHENAPQNEEVKKLNRILEVLRRPGGSKSPDSKS